MSSDLALRFADAGLALAVEREPIDRGWRNTPVEVVQLDIARRRGREWFRIFPGRHENRIRIQAVDPRWQQLVLSVQEARRTYTAIVDGREKVLFTLGQEQHYLCGQDEMHLFMAQLPQYAGSVEHAHRILFPQVPAAYEKQPWIRQGEWFFFRAIEEDARELERLEVLGYGKKEHIGIAEGARIRRVGRPHFASEHRVLKPGRRIFVRGSIRHPDHKTIELRDWHFVLPNREGVNRRTSWID